MRWFLYGVVTLVVVLVIGWFNIPASVIPPVLQELKTRNMLPANAPILQLGETSGTIWSGEASGSTLQIDGVALDLEQLQWTLAMWPLFSGKAVLDVSTTSDELAAKARVQVDGEGHTIVEQLEGRLPVTTLEPWMPMLVTGDIAFFLQRIEFTPARLLALNGIMNFEYIDWVGADYNMPLGSYLAELSLMDDQVISVVISDLEALLGITGTLTINRGGRYHFDALLLPRRGLAPEVNQSIRWFGRVDGSGNVVINTRGQF